MQDVNIFDKKTSSRFSLLEKLPFVNKLSFIILLLTIVLMPLLILPSSWGLQAEFVKKFLFSSGILISFILWLITRLEDGRITVPGGAIFWSSILLLSSFFASAVFSATPKVSLFGLGYENDTFMSFVLFFLAMFLSATIIDSKSRLNKVVVGSIVALLAVELLEMLQIFLPWKLLPGGILVNTVGKWNDLGVLLGLSLIISLLNLELHGSQSVKTRSVFWLLGLTSLLLLTIVNYGLIWIVVGLFSLIIFIYSLASSGDFSKRKILKNLLRPSFVTAIISLILVLSSNSLGGVLSKQGIYQPEVRPSWQSTVGIAKSTMSRSMFFGSGPNTFATEWSVNKPDAVNSTIFWDTEFNVGFGRFPTFAVTLGLYGLIASGLFLISLLYYGVKTLWISFENPSGYFMLVASAVVSLYLWGFSVFYVTDTVILALTFMATGIFVASLIETGLAPRHEFLFLNNPKRGFVSVLVLVILIIAVISGGYLMCRKFMAVYGFQRALQSYSNTGSLDEAERGIKRSIELDEQDLYYRSLTEVYLARLNNLIKSSSAPGANKEEILNQLQTNLSSAAGSARKSTEIDAGNYLNWVTLGKVGEAVLPLRSVVAGSYDLALNSYQKALVCSPKNPSIYLNLARLEAAMGNTSKAIEYIERSLEKKSNYTSALFLLSQIEAGEGHLTEAIKKAEQASLFAPGDASMLFQVGLLKYMNKDYSGAVKALGSAIDVQDNYANAKYFLGLSYSKLGKIKDAIKEFEDIEAMNPDNDEVKIILGNLRAGRGALESINTAPEKRGALPIKDGSKIN